MDIYSEVTARIMEQMEQGIIPWQKPWVACGKAISRTTGKPYSLLNQMLLGRPGEYLTFKQCQAAGGKVRKGEKSQMVVFWKWIETEDEETGEKKEVPFLRYYNVFHIDQCEASRQSTPQKPPFPMVPPLTKPPKPLSVIISPGKRSGFPIRKATGHSIAPARMKSFFPSCGSSIPLLNITAPPSMKLPTAPGTKKD